MSKYINADELLAVADRLIVPDAFEAMKDIANSIPAADVEAVIRCKDCKYANKERLPQGSKWFASCDHFNTHSVMADDYCSYGKRRESDAD